MPFAVLLIVRSMKKIKYYYNTHTLRYEKLEVPLRVILLQVFGFITACILTGLLIVFIIFKYIDSPKEKILRQENDDMKESYGLLQDRINELELQMDELENRDNNVYRSIFGSDPVNANTIFYGSFLKPQTSYNNEVGLTYKDTIIESRVSVYRMDIDNEIAYDPNSYSNVNLAPTTHKGIEAQLAYKILENLRAKLSYSYTEVKFTSGLYAGNIVPNVPENMGSAQLLWDQHQYGKYVAQVNYVGSRYFSGDFYNTDTKLASYTTLDLKAAWEFKPITVSFTGMNMLDKKYSPMGTVYGGVNYYYPGNARTLYLSLTYNFK